MKRGLSGRYETLNPQCGLQVRVQDLRLRVEGFVFRVLDFGLSV